MADIFNDIQALPVTVSFFDGAKKPNPAPVTNIAVSVDDPTLFAAALPATDPATPVTSVLVLLTALGPLGTANLQLTATASDGTVISGSAAYTVVASPAANMQFDAGTPVPIPAPVPDPTPAPEPDPAV